MRGPFVPAQENHTSQVRLTAICLRRLRAQDFKTTRGLLYRKSERTIELAADHQIDMIAAGRPGPILLQPEI